MSKTPNFVLTEAFTYNVKGHNDQRTLPQGTFVRPLELQYVPKDTIDFWEELAKKYGFWSKFDSEVTTYCYCRYGIVPIPKKLLREL